MSLKGYKKYTDLLRAIGTELKEDRYDFVKRNKSNFSKMLKEDNPRRFNFNYIVPLEKLLGVSYARLLDEDSYKLPIDKCDIPFDKGFRYYAYLDNISLYEKELMKISSRTGESILAQTDEFGKTFLDYVVEYNSINGVRFLRDHYHLKLRIWNNQFDTEPKGMFWVNDKGIELARLVANANDTKLFNDIFDPYYMFVMSGYYLPQSIYTQDDFFEILMDHQNLFDSLFEEKEYVLELGRKAQMRRGVKSLSFTLANPVLNGCLNYALDHLDKYKTQAKKILEFGIRHNQELMTKNPDPYGYVRLDEIGGMRDSNGDVIDIAIIVEEKEIDDKEIVELIERLPKFNIVR